MKSEWLAQYGGEWYTWKPLPGLDPSLNDATMWIGAAFYAKEKASGKPEAQCQIEAEMAIFKIQYRVNY